MDFVIVDIQFWLTGWVAVWHIEIPPEPDTHVRNAIETRGETEKKK